MLKVTSTISAISCITLERKSPVCTKLNKLQRIHDQIIIVSKLNFDCQYDSNFQQRLIVQEANQVFFVPWKMFILIAMIFFIYSLFFTFTWDRIILLPEKYFMKKCLSEPTTPRYSLSMQIRPWQLSHVSMGDFYAEASVKNIK